MALSPIKNGLLALIVIQFLLFLYWQVGFRFRFKRQLASLVPAQTKKMRWKEVDPLRMAKSVEEDLYRYAPIQYLANQNQPIVHNWTKNSFCGRWPQMHDIEFSNIYWQRLELSQNHSLYLLGAYLDRRITPHSVRVIFGKQVPLENKKKKRHLEDFQGSKTFLCKAYEGCTKTGGSTVV